MFATSFYLTWLLFAVIYYVICYAHGDLEKENIENMESENATWKPCILEIRDFASCFLFSLETQVREITMNDVITMKKVIPNYLAYNWIWHKANYQ